MKFKDQLWDLWNECVEDVEAYEAHCELIGSEGFPNAVILMQHNEAKYVLPTLCVLLDNCFPKRKYKETRFYKALSKEEHLKRLGFLVGKTEEHLGKLSKGKVFDMVNRQQKALMYFKSELSDGNINLGSESVSTEISTEVVGRKLVAIDEFHIVFSNNLEDKTK